MDQRSLQRSLSPVATRVRLFNGKVEFTRFERRDRELGRLDVVYSILVSPRCGCRSGPSYAVAGGQTDGYSKGISVHLIGFADEA